MCRTLDHFSLGAQTKSESIVLYTSRLFKRKNEGTLCCNNSVHHTLYHSLRFYISALAISYSKPCLFMYASPSLSPSAAFLNACCLLSRAERMRAGSTEYSSRASFSACKKKSHIAKSNQASARVTNVRPWHDGDV